MPHGWTLADVNKLAVSVVTRDTWWSHLMSFPDRLEMAWSAMMEEICLGDRCPSAQDLVAKAVGAIQREAHQLRAAHGTGNQTAKGVGVAGLNFHRYWWQRHVWGFEDLVVDAIAVGQIWERLTPRQQMVLAALMKADGDVREAAESLEYSLAHFRKLLKEARDHFLEWWHEGEKPSRIWMQDGPSISSIALMSTLRRRKREAIAAARSQNG